MPVAFENVPQEPVGSTPHLESPLGAPYIIRPEDWIRLQAAGDQGAAFTRAFQGASSLVDNAYDQQIKMKQAQANLDKSTADTKQIGVHTDLLQQEADQNKQLFPLTLKAKDLENQKTQIALDNASATQDTNQSAINQMGTAFKNFPDPNDVAGYEAARNKWVTDNAVAMTNPTTAQQMQGQLALRDSIWKSHTRYAQLSDARTELYNLQKAGHVPQNYDIDSGLADGSYNQQLVQGRLLDKLSQAQKLYNDAPDQATRNALLPIMGDLNYHAKMSPGPDRPASDRGGLGWGAMQVQGGQSNYLDTNGNWNDNTQPIIDAAQSRINMAAQRTQAQLKEKEPMVDIEYRTGPIDKKTGMPTDIQKLTNIPLSQAGPYLQQPGSTITRSAQGAQAPAAAGAQLGPSPGLPTLSPQIQTRIDDIKRRIDLPENDPQHLTDQQALDLFRQQFPAPATPTRVPMRPGGTQPLSMAEPGRTPTSNNDYRFPEGATDHAGINRNVWANVMSEEGREFGKDGSHDSVFGLWADSPGVEGDAYRTIKQYGPDSPEAYQAVTNAWTNKFLRQSQPWNLQSPGLQELVIADSQHAGGDKARAIIDRMGGWDAVNAMPAGEAIREYSELRKPLWPGNNRPFPDGATDRVTRERAWALRHNDDLQRGSAATSALPRPNTVAEARALPRGSHFLDPEGNRRMVA